MQLLSAVLATTASLLAVTSASPIEARSSSGSCPIQQCSISTTGSGWSSAYLRNNPCNNNSPIKTLYNGNVVYNLGTKTQNGCGYTYMQVLVPGSSGKNTVGWVGSQFVYCNDYPYGPPAPAAATTSSSSSTA